jgi:acetyl esterase/lipase/lysophospholipase L1-like esterase
MLRLAVLPVLLALSLTAQDPAGPTPEPFALEGAVAVPYREIGGVQLRVHLFRPDGWQAGVPRRAVLFFFGGGWTGGTPEQFAPQARYLASRGLVAGCVEYRVRSRHRTRPQDAVADAQAAVAWLHEHAAEQGVDPDGIAVAGGSAGGHLAACAGLAPFREPAAAHARPAALLLFNPVLDTGPEGFARERVGPAGEEISPLHQVARGAPPTLVLHGTADRTVPFAQAAAFRAAMAAVDAHCELIAYEGRGHGFFNPDRSANDHATTTRAMDRFLAGLGWLSGPPTFAEAGGSTWHGYTRRELEVDGARITVVAPDRAAAGRPWIWRARFFGHEPQVDLALLARGFHLLHCEVADLYGNEEALRRFDVAYAHATATLGLAPKAALEGMSRGGLVVYRWAARNPEKVACVYADAPVCDIRSWPGGQGAGRGSEAAWAACLRALGLSAASAATWEGNPIDLLAPLAAARVPLLHVCGAADEVVPVAENTAVLAERYRALGGTIDVIVKPGVGHHPHSLADPAPIVGFVLRHTVEAGDFAVLRDGLARSLQRLRARGSGRVAFLGGSITANPGWRDLVAADLRRRLPGVDLDFVNAGIPSFGSVPGAFRLRRDVLDGGPVDLLFVEAAVNDETNGDAAVEVLRAMEGIVRAVRRADPGTDVVMLHFVDPAKMERIRHGLVPEVIRIHEAVAERYGLPSIDLAAEVTWRIARGEFSWEDDFRDLHPAPFGQRLYAASIARLFDRAWAAEGRATEGGHELPSPLDPASFQRGRLVAPSAAGARQGFELAPAWRPADGAGTRAGFVDVPVLVAEREGATCELRFDGRACGVLVNAGPDAGVLEWALDGAPWRRVDLFTRWSGGLHLPFSYVLAADLPDGPHTLALRVGARPDGTRGGTAVRVVHFLVDGEG